MAIEIRPYTAADGRPLRGMLVSSAPGLVDDLLHGAWPQWVCVDDQGVVGVLQGRFDQPFGPEWRHQGRPDWGAWIFNLVTDRGHLRQGIGTALVLRFAADARTIGATYLALRSSPFGDTQGRLAFFTSLGLIPHGRDSPDPILGASIDDLLH